VAIRDEDSDILSVCDSDRHCPFGSLQRAIVAPAENSKACKAHFVRKKNPSEVRPTDLVIVSFDAFVLSRF
jgi:hypothetical protein